MKVNKIIYWTSTIIFAALFMLPLLGTAKLLGAIALVQPKFKTLKEWAYAGFTINLTGAVWAHVATNTPFTTVMVFFVILAVSYVFWKRTLSAQDVRNVAYA